MSAHGRFVSFVSGSPTLVAGDSNDTEDVFVRDRLNRSTLLVSVGNRGQQPADGAGAGEARVSANGRRVVFTTASALTAKDRNETVDIYVRDLWRGRTTLVSQRPDGRAGNGPSFLSDLSRTGRFVAFQSSASNLVPGDTNALEDVFLRDLRTGRTELVSVVPAGSGAQAMGTEPPVSPNGRRVLFRSLNADDSTTLWIRNRKSDVTAPVDTGVSGHAAVGSWSMSASGRCVAFMTDRGLVPADTNGENDAYRVDRRSGRTILLSVGSNGQLGNAYSETVELSADGQGRGILVAVIQHRGARHQHQGRCVPAQRGCRHHAKGVGEHRR